MSEANDMKLYPHYIACAMLSTRTQEENARCLERACEIARALDVPYVLVNGAYKGVRETSLQLSGPGAQACARVLALAFDQETYLAVESFHCAKLLDRAGTVVASFTQRVEGTPDNYTEDLGKNRYTFVAE